MSNPPRREISPYLSLDGRKFFLLAEESSDGRWRGSVSILEDGVRDKRFMCLRTRATRDHARHEAMVLALTLAFPALRKRFVDHEMNRPADHEAGDWCAWIGR
ncbi:MAG: hypothetical protein PGN26_15825 [Xylophilus ampelinus]